jgi:hypothetical protein
VCRPSCESEKAPEPISAVVAFCDPAEKLQVMLAAWIAQGTLQQLCHPIPGELWLRFGVDGVKMWKSAVISVTLSPTSAIVGTPLHSMYRFGLVAVQRSREAKATLGVLMQQTGIGAALGALHESRRTVAGQADVLIKVFVCGDHMSQSKLTGANGPTSTDPQKRPCPYCDAPPAEVAALVPGPGRPVLRAARANALMPISPMSCPPDAMHGLTRVFFNSVVPRMREGLLWPETRFVLWVNKAMLSSVMDDDYAKTGSLETSITATLVFFRNRHWQSMASLLRRTLTDHLPGVQGTVGELLSQVLNTLSTQVDICYVERPTAFETAQFQAEAGRLVYYLRVLRCKCTPWVHVWCYHLPQFLVYWGTLYMFLGHGVEGRHRLLKKEVARSTCGQWNGDQVGFAYAIMRDNVMWALMRAGVNPHKRPGSHHRLRSTPGFAAFRAAYEQGGADDGSDEEVSDGEVEDAAEAAAVRRRLV